MKLYLVGSDTFSPGVWCVVIASSEERALSLARENASTSNIARADRAHYLSTFKAKLLAVDLGGEFVSEEFGEWV